MTTNYPDYSVFTGAEHNDVNYTYYENLQTTFLVNAPNTDLTIGGHKAINLEAVDGMNLYSGLINNGDNTGGMKFWETIVDDNSDRTDREIVHFYSSNHHLTTGLASVLDAKNNNLLFKYGGNLDFNDFSISHTADHDAIGTGKSGGLLLNNKTTAMATFTCQENLHCRRSIWSSNINLYREFDYDNQNNNMQKVSTAYGFEINSSNQLELIRASSFSNADPALNKIVRKKVAVFGFNDILHTDVTDHDYLVFDELSDLGVGIASTSSNTNNTTNITRTMNGNLNMNQYDIVNGNTSTFETYVTYGADYAEYMKKENPSDKFQTGELVGVNRQGKITKQIKKSIHFGIVSKDPGVLGANIWKGEIPKEGSALYKDYLSKINEYVIVAFCGQVPIINKYNYNIISGWYVIPCSSLDLGDKGLSLEHDKIHFIIKNPTSMTINDLLKTVGVIIIPDNKMPTIIVKH